MPLSEDIVERKRTEEALRNSVEGWRSRKKKPMRRQKRTLHSS